VAPRLLGDGRGIAALGTLGALADSLDFEFVEVERVGTDLRLRLRPPGRAEF
jgi:diaminohydroxyphosphoribosylaminopyrimidine deaminase/5-amino-6-(5-phosphoribosylamino)uracil reductase